MNLRCWKSPRGHNSIQLEEWHRNRGSATWVAQTVQVESVESVRREVADLDVPDVALVNQIPPRVGPRRTWAGVIPRYGTEKRIVRAVMGTDRCCSGIFKDRAEPTVARWSRERWMGGHGAVEMIHGCPVPRARVSLSQGCGS